MTQEHTPTPFRVVAHSWEETGIYAGDERIAVCQINSGVSEETQDEYETIMDNNADFIVRACNSHDQLLEALKAMLFLRECSDEDGYINGIGFVNTDAILDNARAAIAAVEGEKQK
jgi:hypothetical protein